MAIVLLHSIGRTNCSANSILETTVRAYPNLIEQSLSFGHCRTRQLPIALIGSIIS